MKVNRPCLPGLSDPARPSTSAAPTSSTAWPARTALVAMTSLAALTASATPTVSAVQSPTTDAAALADLAIPSPTTTLAALPIPIALIAPITRGRVARPARREPPRAGPVLIGPAVPRQQPQRPAHPASPACRTPPTRASSYRSPGTA
ncbi:hypothetical protein [Streptomyces sp. NPDC127072]|uniref:hypothetical protein n=1 Tax=Streptomyces sp. NPDC127072 TaxID=3347129 RepID=UPI0036524B33